MPLFLLTVGGVFTKQLSARWAIVQLAGRRILVPLIVVQVHVAQPTRTQTSPSSSRPRTAAFHAVDRGSNPLGDANKKSSVVTCFFEHVSTLFFFFSALLPFQKPFSALVIQPGRGFLSFPHPPLCTSTNRDCLTRKSTERECPPVVEQALLVNAT